MSEDVSEAARAMGRRKTPRKAETAAQNAAKGRARLLDPEVAAAARKKTSEAMKAVWARRKAAQAQQTQTEEEAGA